MIVLPFFHGHCVTSPVLGRAIRAADRVCLCGVDASYFLPRLAGRACGTRHSMWSPTLPAVDDSCAACSPNVLDSYCADLRLPIVYTEPPVVDVCCLHLGILLRSNFAWSAPLVQLCAASRSAAKQGGRAAGTPWNGMTGPRATWQRRAEQTRLIDVGLRSST